MINIHSLWKPEKCSHCGVGTKDHWILNECPHCLKINRLMRKIELNGQKEAELRRKEKRLADLIVSRLESKIQTKSFFNEIELLKTFNMFLYLIHFNRINKYREDKIYFDISDLYITALNFLGEEAKDQWTEDDVMEAILRVLQKMK